MPIWDALTFSALCSVPKVHVWRSRRTIVDVLLLGAHHEEGPTPGNFAGLAVALPRPDLRVQIRTRPEDTLTMGV